jgi:hypothetical protein
MGRALPVLPLNLDEIQVASPCSMAWNDMVGGDKVRFCGACQKNVFNLSGMMRAEAVELIRATEGRVCVRFFRRADGTILTEDCPVGLRKALQRAKKMTLGAVATSLGAIAALLAVLGQGALTRRACTIVKDAQTTVQSVVDEPPHPTKGEAVAVPPQEVAGGLRPLPPPEMGKVAIPPKGKRNAPPPREIMGDVAMPMPAVE